ncbi:MAG: GTP-binding protein [Candidatus Kariarchaeaceae archaeon]|jgi:small GTP-binding protein
MATKYFLKITLMGDGAVGKTSLRNRFMGKGFRTEHLMTIGADFATYDRPLDDNNVTYQIWDLAGQDTFRSVRARFFRGSMAGICVFDITRKDSFRNITRWIEEIWRNSGRGVVPIILLGNKADLRDKNSVPDKQAKQYAEQLSGKTKKYGFQVHYMDTSAKTGLNVNEAFDQIGRLVIEGLKKGTIKLN